MREDNGLTHKNQQVFIIMNPIDLNLEPPILAVRYLENDIDKLTYNFFYIILEQIVFILYIHFTTISSNHFIAKLSTRLG